MVAAFIAIVEAPVMDRQVDDELRGVAELRPLCSTLAFYLCY